MSDTIKNRIEEILRTLLGSNKYLVFVSVELKQEISEINPEEYKKKIMSKLFPGTKKTKKEEFLPGISSEEMGVVEKTITGETQSIPLAAIKKLAIRIILDESVTSDLISKLKDNVSRLIEIKPARGDTLTFERMRFPKPPPPPPPPLPDPWWRYLIKPPQIYFLFIGTAFLMIMIVLIFGPFRIFLNNFVKTLAAQREAKAAAQNPLLQAQLGFGTGQTTAGREKAGAETRRDRARLPFQFINEGNLKNLVFLLKNEKPELIAIIMNYLEPSLASKLLASVPVELQSRVISHLSEVKLMQPEEVIEYEKTLKTKIDFLMAGMEHLIDILDNTDPSSQKVILSTLSEENPELAERVRRLVFTFDDLVTLEPETIQIIAREVRMDTFAAALKFTSDEFKNAIIEKFTTGAQDIIRQAIELATGITPQRANEEQRQVVEAIRRLERSGAITIKKAEEGFDTGIESVTETEAAS